MGIFDYFIKSEKWVDDNGHIIKVTKNQLFDLKFSRLATKQRAEREQEQEQDMEIRRKKYDPNYR